MSTKGTDDNEVLEMTRVAEWAMEHPEFGNFVHRAYAAVATLPAVDLAAAAIAGRKRKGKPGRKNDEWVTEGEAKWVELGEPSNIEDWGPVFELPLVAAQLSADRRSLTLKKKRESIRRSIKMRHTRNTIKTERKSKCCNLKD